MGTSSKDSTIIKLETEMEQVKGEHGIGGLWKAVEDLRKDMKGMWFKVGLLAGMMAYLGSYLGKR